MRLSHFQLPPLLSPHLMGSQQNTSRFSAAQAKKIFILKGKGGGKENGNFYVLVFSGSMAPNSFLCAAAQELINGLLQGPDTRAGLQISLSMCLLCDGWCFNILE